MRFYYWTRISLDNQDGTSTRDRGCRVSCVSHFGCFEGMLGIYAKDVVILSISSPSKNSTYFFLSYFLNNFTEIFRLWISCTRNFSLFEEICGIYARDGNSFFLMALNKFVVIPFSLVLLEKVLDCFAKIFRLWMLTEENSGYILMKQKFYSLSFHR